MEGFNSNEKSHCWVKLIDYCHYVHCSELSIRIGRAIYSSFLPVFLIKTMPCSTTLYQTKDWAIMTCALLIKAVMPPDVLYCLKIEHDPCPIIISAFMNSTYHCYLSNFKQSWLMFCPFSFQQTRPLSSVLSCKRLWPMFCPINSPAIMTPVVLSSNFRDHALYL